MKAKVSNKPVSYYRKCGFNVEGALFHSLTYAKVIPLFIYVLRKEFIEELTAFTIDNAYITSNNGIAGSLANNVSI